VSVEQVESPARSYNPGRTDLSLSQYRILSLLGEGSAMSSSLAERLAVRPPSVTAVIDGLVARGLVDRTHSEDDRRRVALGLTPEGEAVLASADRAVNERLEQIAGALGSARSATRAIDNLALWHDALIAHRAARQQQR
jgi:long-chain acyl-CoA synthetase